MKPLERVRSDIRLVRAFSRITPAAVRHRPRAAHTVADEFEKVISAHPDRIAIVDAADHGREVTFAELDRRSNRVAHWATANGITRGSVVALLMPNRPEFVSTWLGLAKVGVVTALINTKLTGEALRHSVDVAGGGHLIVDAELTDQWREAREPGDTTVEWHTGGRPDSAGGHVHDLDAALADASDERPDAAVREGMTTGDPLFYIYTSGTTGLPKAAVFSHGKYLLMGPALISLVDLKPADRMYVTLPLYHTAGGVMALGGTLLRGGSVVLARRFSTSRFWEDCHRYEPTVFQYIGELCRYLLNSPNHPHERDHQLRICLGNGLRPDVWARFQERFGIPRIVEFYGATEGNTTLVNLDDKVGAIGRLPAAAARVAGLRLVEYDIAADAIRRDADGRCIPVDTDSPGEAISRITRAIPFDGYSDADATERKILRNVFKDGDAYFRTGDLLRRDADSYYYFVDRVGDTFRWKGENVSTAEVAHVLGQTDGVLEANVYGVEVPGADGRAGMATLVVDDHFDLDTVQRRAEADLAAYARPLFLRISAELDTTGTFKHRKMDAVTEGFDPTRIDDPVFFLSPEHGSYVPLDAEMHERLLAGEFRL